MQKCLNLINNGLSVMQKCWDPPCRQRCVKNQGGNDNGQDNPGDKAKDRVRPGERHDGQANVLGEQQSCSLVD